MSLTNAYVAGLFSLLGAFSGAWLARRTHYEKWLLENRSEVFARYLELIQQGRSNASKNLGDSEASDIAKEIGVTEAYLPAHAYSRVVRLYLPKKYRPEFKSLSFEIWDLHASEELGTKRYQTMNEKLDRIQAIFEECLKKS